MNLKDQIQSDIKVSMKAKEDLKLQTLRLLSSALHNEEIARGSELDDAASGLIVKREAKKRKEALESFKSAGRDEQAQKEADELKILEVYLPEMMSDDDVSKIVDEEIANSSDANKGQIIGAVMKRVAGQADGGVVSQLVNKKLG